MSVAGTLAVNVVARTSKFIKGMRDARKGLKGFTAESGIAAASLKKLVPYFSGAALTAGVIRFTDSIITMGGELSKTSQRLGIGTEDLAAYRFALQSTAGMASGVVDTAIQRMTRRIGQAAMGTGEAKKFLDAWGISAKEFAKIGAAGQFKVVTANIAEAASQSERLAMSMAFFDTEGAGVATNIGAIADEAERFKKIGFAPNSDEAKRLESIAQSFTDLGVALQGWGGRIVIDASQDIQNTVAHLVWLVQKIKPEEKDRRKRSWWRRMLFPEKTYQQAVVDWIARGGATVDEQGNYTYPLYSRGVARPPGPSMVDRRPFSQPQYPFRPFGEGMQDRAAVDPLFGGMRRTPRVEMPEVAEGVADLVEQGDYDIRAAREGNSLLQQIYGTLDARLPTLLPSGEL